MRPYGNLSTAVWHRFVTGVSPSVAVLAAAMLHGCSDVGPLSLTDTGGQTSTPFTIRGRSFTIPFDAAGILTLPADQTVSASGTARLFDENPTEPPASGWMTLPASSITIEPTAAPKTAAARDLPARALPLNGTATVRVAFVAGNVPEMCGTTRSMAEFEVVLTAGVASVPNERYPLTPPALEAIAANNVTLCTEVTSDFDGLLTLGEFQLTFDGGETPPMFLLRNLSGDDIGLLMPGEVFSPETTVSAGRTRMVSFDGASDGQSVTIRAGSNTTGLVDSIDCPNAQGSNYVATIDWTGTSFTCTAQQDDGSTVTASDSSDPDLEAPDGTIIQVPIEADRGGAVAAKPTQTINTVDYAIVGVLDAATPDAPTTTDYSGLGIELADLGLQSVQTIHMATYSSWVADLPDGTTIATLSLSFADGTEPQTIPLVLGSDTAEWSYDRPEYATLLGGVRHDQAPVLYSFKSTLDSAGDYTGYVYRKTIELDPPRNLLGISLTVADVDSLGPRPDAVNPSAWAAQSVPAITLVGPKGAPPDTILEFTSGSGDAAPRVGDVYGTVLNAATGSPLSGVVLTVDEALASAVSNDAGGFTFDDLPAGLHTIDASLDGFVSSSTTLAVIPGEVVSAIIQLTAVGSIAGTVVDGRSGEPLTGAQVTVDSAAVSVTTDGTGAFTLADLPDGTYVVSAADDGYAPAQVSVTLIAGQVASASLTLFPAGIVTGEVVDAQTGQPLLGVLIAVDASSATAATDGSGTFTLTTAPEGSRTLTATLAGYVQATVPVTVTAGETTETSIGLLAVGGGGDGVAVVLSWGSAPRDLDLHVSGPDGGGGRFHVAYYALAPVGHASLDLDDTQSFGPETVTVSPTDAGTYVAGDYHVWIHNYSNEATFGVSGGVVTLFAAGAQFAQYQVGGAAGTNSATIWRVVEFTVAQDGTVSAVNPLESFEDGTDQSLY